MRKKEIRNIRTTIEVPESINQKLDILSNMMKIPKATLVSVIFVDGFRQYQNNVINTEMLYCANSRTWKKSNNSCVVKFSIPNDVYCDIKETVDYLNRDDEMNIRYLFVSLCKWYFDNKFNHLISNNINFWCGVHGSENVIDDFYRNKSIDYGVPFKNLQSFYMAELLNYYLNIESDNRSGKMNTNLFLHPSDIE